MSVDRTEHVMMGISVDSLPFEYFDDEYERYTCGFKDEPLHIVSIPGGYIVGYTLALGDSYAGMELTEIDEDFVNLRFKVTMDIKEKLAMGCSQKDVKIYAFSSWD